MEEKEEQLKEKADKIKKKGNAAYKKKDYDLAIELYTQAIGRHPSKSTHPIQRSMTRRLPTTETDLSATCCKKSNFFSENF